MFLKVFQIKHRIRAATAAAVMICLSGIAAVMLFSSVRDGARHDAYADVYSGAISGALPDTSGEVSSAPDAPEPVRLCVVMYHGLIKDSSKQNRYFIDPQYLEDDLRFLTENGYHTIVTKDLTDHFRKGAPLPDKPVMLTFDDGYYNNYLYAFPLLKKYGCRAVVSPIGQACESAASEEHQDEFYSQCTVDQLKEMHDSGLVEIAYHTYRLHSLEGGVQGVQKRPDESDKEYVSRLSGDIKSFRECMRAAAGEDIGCFTYPFGAKSGDTEKIVRAEGFSCALDCEEKINLLSSAEELYSVHRFLRDGERPAEEFFRDKL